MCDAHEPPRPGDPIYALWREDPIPVVGEEVELAWGDHTMSCRVDKAEPSKVYDGEPRRLHMTVVG